MTGRDQVAKFLDCHKYPKKIKDYCAKKTRKTVRLFLKCRKKPSLKNVQRLSILN